MSNLFLFLFLLSIAGLVVGLIKPSYTKLKSRREVSFLFGVAIIVFFILVGVTGQSTTAPSVNMPAPQIAANTITPTETATTSASSTPSTPIVNNTQQPTSNKTNSGGDQNSAAVNQTAPAPVSQPTTPPPPALVVSCSPAQSTLTTGQTGVWAAQASGGVENYSYSWSGTGGLSGNSKSASISYGTAGTKSASVVVTSGSQSVNQSCNGTITVSNPAPQPINLSGSNQQATQQFQLQAGLSVFTYSYSGSGNFIAYLMDNNGNEITSVANTIGSSNGSIAVNIPSAGSYLINVQAAQGSWNFNITQPRPSTAPSTTSFNGNGQQATSLFYLSSGLHVFQTSNSGSGNFIVYLLDQNGNVVDSVANSIGSSNGSQAEGIDSSGIYLLSVQSEGSWTISIQ